jgi:hypothetical protein
MTGRKARATAMAMADSSAALRNDNQKGNSKGNSKGKGNSQGKGNSKGQYGDPSLRSG